MPELTARPCIVDVRIEQKWNHETQKSFDFVHSKQYLGETGCSSYIIKNTRKPNRTVPLFAIFYLHDKFLTHASKKNQFVDVVTGEDEAKVWRGPILIIKSQGFVCTLILYLLTIIVSREAHSKKWFNFVGFLISPSKSYFLRFSILYTFFRVEFREKHEFTFLLPFVKSELLSY